MGCPKAAIKPQGKDCLSCGHSTWLEDKGILACEIWKSNLLIVLWMLKSDFDEEGFPTKAAGPCPGWKDGGSDE